MGTYILKRFSANRILNTKFSGFIRGRNYDQDINRLCRLSTKRQMGIGNLNGEMRKLKSELNEARLGIWQHTD